MLSLRDFILGFAKEYSVIHFDEIESGVFVDKIKEDIYLMRNGEVKE